MTFINSLKKSALPLLAALCLASCHHTPAIGLPMETVALKGAAPFAMPDIEVPNFGNSPKFIITDFGAVPNDMAKTSAAIKTAIDKVSQNGGGIVVIPKGEWLTGPVHFKSNVNLHLEEGAVLNFSPNPDHYLPAVHTTWEGMECYNYSPLIYAYNCRNVAITGKGTVKAGMETWEKWFARPAGHMNSLKYLYDLAYKNVTVEQRLMVNDSAHLRPQFIQFNRCQNVLLDGFKIRNSPFWTVHPYLCKNVLIRNLDVYAHGHNNDGIDPEMSENVLIEDCVFDQGDDAISVKSGRDMDAWRLNAPAKNIIVRNCLVKNGHQLMAIGSELSGGIENVLVQNCKVEDGAKLNHLLFIKTNERRGGYVKGMYLQNVSCGHIDLGILGIETDVLYQWKDLMPTYVRKLTPISDVYVSDIKAKDVQFVSRIQGQEELPVTRVTLKNISPGSIREQKYIHKNLKDFNDE